MKKEDYPNEFENEGQDKQIVEKENGSQLNEQRISDPSNEYNAIFI